MIYRTKPMDHQFLAYDFLIDLYERGLNYGALFMDMGTGKTKTTIDVVSNLFMQGKIDAVLLVAPNLVQRQWKNEQVPEHSPVIVRNLLWLNKKSQSYKAYVKDFIERQWDSKIQEEDNAYNNKLLLDKNPNLEKEKLPLEKSLWPEQKKCLKWFYVNVERFQVGDKKTFAPFIDYIKNHKVAILIDEATSIKNPKSKRSQNLTVLNKGAAYSNILTGSPIANSHMDVYSMFNFMDEKFWDCNYFVFTHRYGIFIKDINKVTGRPFSRKISDKDIARVRKLIKEDMDDVDISIMLGVSQANVKFLRENPTHDKPYKRLEELKSKTDPFSFTIRKDQCIDIPSKIYQVLKCEMSATQKRLYKELVSKFLTSYADQVLTVHNKISLTMRLQQITGGHFPFKDEEQDFFKIKKIEGVNPKLARLKQEIEEAGNLKIIIWCCFVPEILLLKKELSSEFPFKKIESYYGGVSNTARERIKNEFTDGLIDIMIINPQVGSMGLNLQVSSLHYFYSNNYNLKDRMQAEDRSHRIGQTKNCTYKDLVMENTIDEKILDVLKNKKQVSDYFRENNLSTILQ